MGRKIISFLLIFLFSNAVYAEEIKLYKSGTTVRFKIDMHCMDNATALKVINRVKLCKDTCKIELEGLKKQNLLQIKTLKDKLSLNKKMYSDIISVKDTTINEIQKETLAEISKQDNSSWLKITLSFVGGIVIGAGIAVGVAYAIK